MQVVISRKAIKQLFLLIVIVLEKGKYLEIENYAFQNKGNI